MRRVLSILCVLGLSCGREVPLSWVPQQPGVQPSMTTADAGCGSLPFGPDCCESGRRVTSATCVAATWTCEQGTFCTCEGKRQEFACAEYCGSDAFAAPDCVNGEWVCASPTRPTSLCAAGTCWGEPGDCCGAPSCVDGGWVCGFRPAGC